MSNTLSNNLLKKVLTLVMLITTGPEVFVATMTIFFYDSYDALEETLTHMNSLKLEIYPGDNVTNCCDAILVDDERLESSGAFNTDHLGYINHIFVDNYDSRFRLLVIR